MIFSFAKKYIWNKYFECGFRNFEIKSDGLIVDYWDNNKNNETVVLLHGFGAQAEFQWYKQIKVLSEKYRVIIPNLLYFGNTTHANKFKPQDQVDLVEILARNLNLQKFDLIGISYGGLIGAEFCLQNREMIKKLVLIDSPVKYFNDNDLRAICRNYKIEKINDLFAPRDYFGLKKQFEAAYFSKPLIPNFIFKTLYRHLCLNNVENWEKLIQELKLNLDNFSQREYLFDNPTLLIWGEYDDIVPVRIGNEINNHLINSKLVIIKNSKHLPNLERADEFNRILIDYLSVN